MAALNMASNPSHVSIHPRSGVGGIEIRGRARLASRCFQPLRTGSLLDVDPRTIDRAIEDGTISVVRLGRRLLIPRRPFLAALGVDPASRPSIEAPS
jgi:hypothetical protein